MASTFMDLTNKILRRVNDVEITESDFVSAKGIQGAAKDYIQDIVKEINSSRIDWPFNAVEHTQVLQVGVEEYAWPLYFTAADWNSFQIQKDDVLNINHKQLKPISREEWYDYFRDTDYDSEDDGKNIPSFVFPSHGQGFGVTPSPNEEYTLKYRYYKTPASLVNFDDEVTIYDKFDYVILAGAMYYMNLFKENAEAADRMNAKYKEGLRDMMNALLPNVTHMEDRRVNLGGGTNPIVNGFYWYRGR